MSSTQLRISSKFPEGYGDFAIQSSDDGVCYFPSAPLSHMSCVFRDMMNLGGPNEQAMASTTLKITETLDVTELFLIHLDPEQFPPPIDPNTVEGLLQMADKYQVLKIIRWFERETTAQHGSIDTEIQKPFVIIHPVIVLSLACRFGLEKVGRIAMRELIRCNDSVVYDHTRYFDPIIHRELYRLRKQRIQRYSDWICYSIVYNGLDPGCNYCTDHRTLSIRSMMDAVHTAPSWERFSKIYEAGRNCNSCGVAWTNVSDGKIPIWQKIAENEEKILPTWPVQDADMSS